MKHALVVGVDEYKHSRLNCAVRDATGLAELLRMREFTFDCRVLSNSKATRANIRKELDRLASGGAECVFFFFAGHGCVARHKGYIQTFDSTPYEEGVLLDEIYDLLLSQSPAETRVLVVLDCCHAGFMPLRGDEGGAPLRCENVSRSFSAIGSGRAVMAACEWDGSAAESTETQHGVFTAAILDGLMGGAANETGEVTVTGLHDFVVEALEKLGAQQKPVFKGDFAGRFVLGSGLTPAVTAKKALPERGGRAYEGRE